MCTSAMCCPALWLGALHAVHAVVDRVGFRALRRIIPCSLRFGLRCCWSLWMLLPFSLWLGSSGWCHCAFGTACGFRICRVPFRWLQVTARRGPVLGVVGVGFGPPAWGTGSLWFFLLLTGPMARWQCPRFRPRGRPRAFGVSLTSAGESPVSEGSSPCVWGKPPTPLVSMACWRRMPSDFGRPANQAASRAAQSRRARCWGLRRATRCFGWLAAFRGQGRRNDQLPRDRSVERSGRLVSASGGMPVASRRWAYGVGLAGLAPCSFD